MAAVAEEPYPGGPSPVPSDAPDRARQAVARVRPLLEPELERHGVKWGAPVCLRVFKESAELELWMRPSSGAENGWRRVRVYRIACFSGELGPKTKEGDFQAPEGVYEVGLRSLNPASSYHLSFNLGYPNAYDRHHGRTGSLLMVHGKRVSIGCYAMTDDSIEQIYGLVEAALRGGQDRVAVHCFPFRMTAERMGQATEHGAFPFWEELWPIYNRFEASQIPPVVRVRAGRYRVE
jgi:murein L,D-transpeptidase YafK